MKDKKMMQSISNMRITLEWVGHHAENVYYCDEDILREFSLLGFEDGTWKNEECPHFDFVIEGDDFDGAYGDEGYILQVWLKSEYSEFEDMRQNHSIELFKPLGGDTEDQLTHVFEDEDIWIIWSVIRSNLSYFERLNKEPNPYSEWSESSIGDALFELREWIVEDWLESKSVEPKDECNDMEQYNKYNQLNDALMEILNNNERKEQ